VRFMTLPEGNDDGEGGVYTGMESKAGDGGETRDWISPSQPPTTITATLNPMMGHFSTAYASRLGRDIVACSR
jgi:distribution and morphology protein 10